MKIIWPALIIFLLHASVHAADKIKVGIPPGVHAYIPLAQKKGFFKEEGLAAEVIEMRSPAVAIVALANGEIDYFSVIGSSVTAALGGPKGDAGSTTHARNFKEGELKMK